MSLLDPSLVCIPHVGIEFYMNDEIIQSKANSGNKRFPRGLKRQDSVDKEMYKTWEQGRKLPLCRSYSGADHFKGPLAVCAIPSCLKEETPG